MFEISLVPVRRALLSVSEKTGLVDLARGLNALGIEMLSTGGTAQLLRDAGLPVIDVSAVTGFPEIMDGRVKTLHPRIHGGLLARRGVDDAVMEEHGIAPIDLLIVNLYPFEQAISMAGSNVDDGIDNIDIGGPAMLRAAAKNHQDVVTVVDPADYADLLEALSHGGTALSLRRALAAKAYAHTARYDSLISSWLCAQNDGEHADPFPPNLHLSLERRQKLRYGENPHQSAALYVERQLPGGIVAGAQLLAGKELSYNNLADADAALECVKAFSNRAACVIVKHGNPCGAALADDPLQAYDLAHACDPTSAFGGVIAFNQRIDAATAGAILERQFVELIVAPEIDEAALPLFASKPNVRVMASGWWPSQTPAAMDYKRISGGMLMQDADRDTLLLSDLQVVSKRIPDAEQLRDLLFAWHVAMYVKSNAIVYARDSRTIGIGAGQMSRVDSTRIATFKAQAAQLDVADSVMASDAFFPFRDAIDTAAEAGVRCVIQPGGSMRDAEVIAAADEHDMIMVFTGVRHFRH